MKSPWKSLYLTSPNLLPQNSARWHWQVEEGLTLKANYNLPLWPTLVARGHRPPVTDHKHSLALSPSESQSRHFRQRLLRTCAPSFFLLLSPREAPFTPARIRPLPPSIPHFHIFPFPAALVRSQTLLRPLNFYSCNLEFSGKCIRQSCSRGKVVQSHPRATATVSCVKQGSILSTVTNNLRVLPPRGWFTASLRCQSFILQPQVLCYRNLSHYSNSAE